MYRNIWQLIAFWNCSGLNYTRNESMEIIHMTKCNITRFTVENSIWECAKKCLEWMPRCIAISHNNETNECRFAGNCSNLYLQNKTNSNVLFYSMNFKLPNFNFFGKSYRFSILTNVNNK